MGSLRVKRYCRLPIRKIQCLTTAFFVLYIKRNNLFRVHSSLRVSPYEAHFNPLHSCQLARENVAAHSRRQTQLRSLYSKKPENIFKEGDRVLLRTKKHNFHKYSPISYPTFTQTAYTIKTVDDSVYPPVYTLLEYSGDRKRRFYGFELFKLDPAYDYLKKRVDKTNQNKIFVEDVWFEKPSKLRSGKVVPGKEKAVYLVRQNNKTDTVGENSLSLWKSVLGDDVLFYSSNFADPRKASYKI